MKKLFLVLFLGTVLSSVATAQPRSIGLRLGGNQELTIQQYLNGQSQFLQIDAGMFYGSKGLQATVTYNWLSQSLNSPAFSLYGGFGLALGYSWADNDWYPRFLDTKAPDYQTKWNERVANRRYFFTGVVGHFGIEYKFDEIPVAISLDYRPLIGIEIGKAYYPNGNNPNANQTGEDAYISKKLRLSYHTPGLWAFALSGRYFF